MTRSIRTLVATAGIVSASLVGGSLALADGGHGTDQQPGVTHKCGQDGKRFERGRQFFRKLAKQLGLTEQQKTQIKGIFKSYREKNKPLLQAMHNEKRQMKEMIMSGSTDEAAIRAQSAKVAAVQADLAVSRAAMAKEIKAVLTPDQAAKLKILMKEREKKMEQFRERHGHHGDGIPME